MAKKQQSDEFVGLTIYVSTSFGVEKMLQSSTLRVVSGSKYNQDKNWYTMI